MFLSRLEIIGFKSFLERTDVRFGPGMTGIVGPNGCGKTNILDAIRWVMGEQRPTLLRGGRMDEVIFNGAPGVSPVGMAEVSLTVENNRGILPVNYSEVVITRRLFRSGESEYLLNRVPCRLKDIVELFLDTGMGSHAYAVFQQSMIEALLSEKPEDRLGLFEEAAGVAKYKHRRRAAQRKLEATETDLVRLADLFSEVEKQHNGLKRQVKKAEKYKNLEDERKTLKVRLASLEYRELKSGEEKTAMAVRALEIEEAELLARRQKFELEKETLALKLIEKEEEKRKLEEELSGLVRRGMELDNRRTLLLKENESYAERKTELETELARSAERSKAIDEEIEGLRREKEERTSSRTNLGANLLYAEAELNELSGRMAEIAGRKTGLLEEREAIRLKKTDLESEKKVWESKGEETLRALNELDAEDKKLAAELDGKNKERQKADRELTALGRRLTGLSEAASALEETLAGLGAKKEETAARLQDLEKRGSELEGRLAVLEDLEKNYGGYEPATKEILSRKQEFPGIIDSLANMISADEKHLGPIEAALGDRAQALVATNWQEVQRVFEFLKEKNLGRARFLVLSDEEIVQPEAEAWPGAIGWASDLIESEHLALARKALRKILVVENREAAFRLAPRSGENATLVTLSAEVFGPGGFFAGGEAKGAFLVGRKAELSRLREQFAETQKQRRELSGALEGLQEELTSAKNELEKITAEREGLVVQESEHRLAFEKLLFEGNSLSEKTELLRKNRIDLESRHREAGEKLRGLEAALSSTTEKETEGERVLSSLDGEEQNLSRSEREKQEVLTKNRMELVSVMAHLESIEKDLARLADEREESAGAFGEKQRKLLELVDLHENFDVRVTEIGSAEEEVRIAQGEFSAAKEKLARETAELSSGVSALEKQLKETASKLNEVSGRKHEKEIAETDWRARKESLSSRFLEDYHQTLDVFPDAETFPETPVEALKAKVDEIEKSLANLGAVNLEALTEYPTAAERYEFMKRQIEDLTKAKEELAATITQINQNAHELFLKTFEIARQNFKTLFADLFEGGQADLILESTEDPLEPDLKIVARPKGKKLVTIQQLSGGEKALTAIALLFALYMVKPSPFCILDEIDAPLDDANIDRFLSILRKFSQGETQFIVITHNKRTMEAADVLYGVTMEKTGISKLVSVRLEGLPVGSARETEVSELTR